MIKKIFIPIFFLILIIPFFALAQADPKTEGDKVPAAEEGIVPEGDNKTIPDPLKGQGVQDLVTKIFNIAYGLAGLVAIGYLILGGYQYITSSGNPDLSAQAKGTIVNAIVGLVIILASYLIIRFALDQLGAKGVLG